jgi:hypothetical protein
MPLNRLADSSAAATSPPSRQQHRFILAERLRQRHRTIILRHLCRHVQRRTLPSHNYFSFSTMGLQPCMFTHSPPCLQKRPALSFAPAARTWSAAQPSGVIVINDGMIEQTFRKTLQLQHPRVSNANFHLSQRALQSPGGLLKRTTRTWNKMILVPSVRVQHKSTFAPQQTTHLYD